MRIEAWSVTDIGLVREANEDAVGFFPEKGLFIVADGMGGHECGAVASRLAVGAIADELHDAVGVVDCVARLEAAVQSANTKIVVAGAAEAGRAASSAMGTTVIILSVDIAGRSACWAHVGDSRLYRMRAGELQLLTADHTLIGEIHARQGALPLALPHSHQLTRALGVDVEVEIATDAARIEVGDMFLLCSDGISGLVAPELLYGILAADTSIEDAANELLAAALAGGGGDNASLVLVRVVDGESSDSASSCR